MYRRQLREKEIGTILAWNKQNGGGGQTKRNATQGAAAKREGHAHKEKEREREKDVTWSDNRGILFLHRDGDRVTVGHFRSNYLCAAPSAATRLLHAPRPIGGDVTQSQSLTKIKQLQTLYYIPPPFTLPLANLSLILSWKIFINRLLQITVGTGQVRSMRILYMYDSDGCFFRGCKER